MAGQGSCDAVVPGAGSLVSGANSETVVRFGGKAALPRSFAGELPVLADAGAGNSVCRKPTAGRATQVSLQSALAASAAVLQ